MMALAVKDFPEPDSPTMQTISCLKMSNEIFWTAYARSPPPGRAMARSRTDSRGASEVAMDVFLFVAIAQVGVERVAQAFADRVDGQYRRKNRPAGPDDTTPGCSVNVERH